MPVVRSRKGRAGFVVALLCLFCTSVLGQEPWTVWVAGQEARGLAATRTAGGVLFVDVRGLADLLGISVQVSNLDVEIRSTDGTTWTAPEGAFELRSAARVIALGGPLLIVDDAVYLDVSAVASVSGFALRRQPEQLRIEFVPPVDAATRLKGWRQFTIAKAPEEIEAARKMAAENVAQAGTSDVTSVLPVGRDLFRLGTGVGYVPGADAALEFRGVGRISGMATTGSAFLTLGDRGPAWYDGQVALEDPEGGRKLIAGDLVNEIRGLSRGVSVSWRAARGRQPSVSWYRPRFRRDSARDVLAYRDQLMLGSHVMLEAEAGSDRRLLGKTTFATRRIGVNTYYHHGVGERDLGGDMTVNVWRDLAVGGAIRVSDGDSTHERFRQAFVRVPLARRVALRLERTYADSPVTTSGINAVTLNLPVGPVQFLTRWQDRDVEIASTYALGRYAHAQQGLQTTAAYAPARWIHLNLQMATEWLPNGRTEEFQEASARVVVSRRTSMQATLRLPDVQAMERLRVRVAHQMTPDLALVAEVGRFSAFQAPVVAGDVFPSRFKVFVRRDWNVVTPAHGGSVTGRVADQIGIAVPGAVVRLGSYRTVTDTSGRYNFERVPQGTYPLTLDADHLPAGYSTNSTQREIAVQRHVTVSEDFVVAPLNSIHGRVYVDRNGNGRPDAGEGMGQVVLQAGGRLTTTAADGTYAFYNLEPGVYAIQIVLERLSAAYEPSNEPVQIVELEAGHPPRSAEFRLLEKKRKVIFQELRK